jgi:hypothetical protein
MEVGYWGMVGGVLAEDLCAIRKISLEGFSKDGVKRFILACADVQTTKGESYHLLKTLQVISNVCCNSQVLRSEGPNVDYALDGRTWFKDFNRQ